MATQLRRPPSPSHPAQASAPRPRLGPVPLALMTGGGESSPREARDPLNGANPATAPSLPSASSQAADPLSPTGDTSSSARTQRRANPFPRPTTGRRDLLRAAAMFSAENFQGQRTQILWQQEAISFLLASEHGWEISDMYWDQSGGSTFVQTDAKIELKGRHKGEIEENQDKKWFVDIVNGESSSYKAPKIQARKVSIARWDEELGLGEVIENKGCIWKNTGIIRNGKLYCHIEELLFLADKGALILRNIDNTTHEIKDIILKVASGKAGCSWEAFLAYRHLKSLGYIVGRYNTSWTTKNKEVEDLDDSKHDQEVKEHISALISDMQIIELKPTFQVHFPNNGFKKSLPGDPGFILCVLWERPPSRVETETLQKKCGRIPLKFCFVDHGRISFFSHQNFGLPTLQVERTNEEISEGNQGISSLLAIINNDSDQVSINGCHEMLKSEDINMRNAIWKNDGINQNSKLDCHIEGKLSFVDRKIRLLERINDAPFRKEEIHLKLANEEKSWARDVLETYNYMISLGYIVRHFDSPWSIQSYKDDRNSNILEESTTCNGKHDHEVEEKICTLLEDMQISESRPTFNVYCHHSNFKNSSCDPDFIVCVLWERPPSRKEAENIQKKCGNIPLKFCFVDDRHVSFFSYERIGLPTLP